LVLGVFYLYADLLLSKFNIRWDYRDLSYEEIAAKRYTYSVIVYSGYDYAVIIGTSKINMTSRLLEA
jgi:hypothetical protein